MLPNLLYIYTYSHGGPFHKRFYHPNSNSTEIPFGSHRNYDELIGTNFGTCHDCCAVMACAKICSDITGRNEITVN